MTMARNLLELVTGDLEDKRRYRRYRARVEALPEGWREAAHALERYLMNLGPSDDGAALVAMLDDLADLLERSAADGLTVRDVVGERPVEFADAFAANYGGGGWIRKEQGRLTSAIDDAAAAQSRAGGASA